MAGLVISFDNRSAAAFQRSAYERWESVVDVDAQLPEDTLKPNQIQTMAINNDFIAGEGATTFWCCWFHEATSARFGVKIHEAGQPFGMGYQPSWQVMADHAPIDADPNWQDNGNDPAVIYNRDLSIGFKIKAVPSATHETLSVVVLIQDIPKA